MFSLPCDYITLQYLTQFIFRVQYALVSLSKDFLVLGLRWLVEFKKFPQLFSKTLRHIYIKNTKGGLKLKKTGFDIIVPEKKTLGWESAATLSNQVSAP